MLRFIPQFNRVHHKYNFLICRHFHVFARRYMLFIILVMVSASVCINSVLLAQWLERWSYEP
jgi:hypothetical protein